MEKRFFDELNEGERLVCEPVMLTKEEIMEFGKKFDPQIFHTDEELASNSIFGGLVASSLHTLSVCTRVVVKAQCNVAVLSGISMHEVKMFNPVRPNDILSVKAWWADLKKSGTKPDRGFASIKCKVSNQRGELVLEYGYRYLIACRNFQPAAEKYR